MLLSYAKIALQHDLLESARARRAGAASAGSPAISRRRCASASPATSSKHSLRREIIALGLTNAIVNRGGPAMAVRLADETRRTTAEVAHAFLAAREVFELPALWQRIDALDGKAKGDAQLALYQATQDLVNAQTLWFLRNGAALADLAGTIARHRAGVAALKAGARGRAARSPPGAAARQEAGRLGEGGVPADLAADVAALDVLGLAPPITEIAEETGTPVPDAARIYLAIGEHLRISDLAAKAARDRHARLLRPPGRRPGAEPAGRRAGDLHARCDPRTRCGRRRRPGSPAGRSARPRQGRRSRRSPARAR